MLAPSAPPPYRRLPFWLQPARRFSSKKLRTTLEGRHVLITGASSGIGAETARLCAQHGARVHLVARREADLINLCTDINTYGGHACYTVLDLKNQDAVSDFASTVAAATKIPLPNFFISCAGKSIRRDFNSTRSERMDTHRCAQLNYLAPVSLISHLLPVMQRRGSGHILNVSTVSARLLPAPRWAAYQSSKAAFDIWFQVVASELAQGPVSFSSVYFPLVHTPMSAPSVVFNTVPGMLPSDAAATLAHTLITRKRRVAPWWLWWAECGGVLARRPVEWGLAWHYRNKQL